MTIVTISSSSRHYPMAAQLAETLRAEGLEVYTPDFAFDETRVSVSASEKARLTEAFFEKIRSADLLLVNSVDGYTGVSVCLEVGFAHALGKTVLFVESPAETAVASLGSLLERGEDGSIIFPTSGA